jgi:hypothetical protein
MKRFICGAAALHAAASQSAEVGNENLTLVPAAVSGLNVCGFAECDGRSVGAGGLSCALSLV